MRFVKPTLKILLLCITLVAVAAIPLALTNFNNSRLLNKPTFSAVSSEQATATEAGLSTLYRLQFMVRATNEVTNMDLKQNSNRISEEEQTRIIQAMEAQLTLLADAGALPPLNFSDYQIPILSKSTYIDPERPQHILSVWAIYVEYTDFQVNLWMDTETFALYEIGITSTMGTLNYNPEEIQATAFFDYLGMSREKLEQKISPAKNQAYYFYHDEIPVTYCVTKGPTYILYILETRFTSSLEEYVTVEP